MQWFFFSIKYFIVLRLFFDVALLAQMGRGCAELFLAVAGEVRGRAETELPGYFPESDIRVTDFLVDKFGFPFLHPLIGTLIEIVLELPVEGAFRNAAQTGKLLDGLYLPVIVQDKVLELAPHSGSAGKKASQFVFGIKAAQYQNDFLLFKNMHVPAQQSRFQIEQHLPQGMKQRLTDGQGVVVGDNRFLMRNGIEIHLVAHRYFLVPEQQEAFCRGDARQAVLFPLRYEQHPVGMHGDGMLPAQLYQHLSFEHEQYTEATVIINPAFFVCS
jgi:hypothetical protein